MGLLDTIAERLGEAVGRFQRATSVPSGIAPTVSSPATVPAPNRYAPAYRAGMAYNWFAEPIPKVPLTQTQLVHQFRSDIYVCANGNAETVAAVPWGLFAARKNGQKMHVPCKAVGKEQRAWLRTNPIFTRILAEADEVVEILEHPFITLMRGRTESWSGIEAMQVTQIFLELTGMAYWYIVKNSVGTPIQRYPLQSHKVIPWVVAGKVVRYLYMATWFTPEEIVLFRCPSPLSSFTGYGPMHAASFTARRQTDIETFEDALLSNGGVPPMIISTDEPLDEEQWEQLKSEYKEQTGGQLNAGQPLLLPFKVRVDTPAIRPSEIQKLADKRITREEIWRIFGRPLSKGDTTQTSANAYQGNLQYTRDTIVPRLRRIEEPINEQLIVQYPSEKKLMFAFQNPTPEDKDYGLRKGWAMARTSGLFRKNEIRKAMGEDPDPGFGDEIYERADLVTAGNPSGEHNVGEGTEKPDEQVGAPLGG